MRFVCLMDGGVGIWGEIRTLYLSIEFTIKLNERIIFEKII